MDNMRKLRLAAHHDMTPSAVPIRKRSRRARLRSVSVHGDASALSNDENIAKQPAKVICCTICTLQTMLGALVTLLEIANPPCYRNLLFLNLNV
jgi:hypothetical protein